MNWIPEYNNFEEAIVINKSRIRLNITVLCFVSLLFNNNDNNKKKKPNFFIYYFVGTEYTSDALNIFEELVTNGWRVLYSMWSPSTWMSSGAFVPIGYPLDLPLSDGDPIYKIWSYHLITTHEYLFSLASNIDITMDIFNEILHSVWNGSGIQDNATLRAVATCQWLTENPNIWTRWLPDVDGYLWECSLNNLFFFFFFEVQ
ncbi:hypothetical protein RFI_33263 [Reticulomyxa filosa]|uniref:Uncharacterized protein n=1 Tax=Reticulomyxa filosa TaxID=46433 RepID=X6LR73_RETFI|nr:hypothetical protein RFI_33263 [Reticulomyxa filosa]|eukprot:ETO04139.1 hypothetical protein RFI_33263 [Reticulomyxa filosa]